MILNTLCMGFYLGIVSRDLYSIYICYLFTTNTNILFNLSISNEKITPIEDVIIIIIKLKIIITKVPWT